MTKSKKLKILFKMKIKTIDLNAKEWFDKINGNSYFSAVMVLNYGLKNAYVINLKFQYLSVERSFSDFFSLTDLRSVSQKIIIWADNYLEKCAGDW